MVTYTNEQVQLQCAAKSLTNAQIFGSLLVQGGGNGYTSTPNVSITGGGGTGATATASITGPVTGVAVTNGGSGYTSATVGFSGGGGSGAAAYAIINGGQITAIRVTQGGTGYTSPPTVSITGNGSGATAQATMSVMSINLTNAGSGYTSHPTVTISAPTGPGGGATATAYAKAKDGSVESVYLAGDMNSLKGLSFLTFKDSSTNNFSDMFVITSYENYDSPLLAFTQGAIMEKDLMVGGLVGSGQGTLWLNHGLVGRPILSSPPCIGMRSSSIQYPSGSTLPSDPETGQLFNHNGTLKMWAGSEWVEGDFTGYYDTLFLFKNDGKTPAHMHLGKLFATGGAKLNAVAIGMDEYGDIPYEYESIQLNPVHNLRFCFGTNERMVLENTGVLRLPDGVVQFASDTRLARVNDGVLSVQSKVGDTWFLGTLNASNIFVDHVNTATGQGLTLFDPKIYFGIDQDTNLYRAAENILKTDDALSVMGSVSGASLYLNAAILWGEDVNLYRSVANVLKTDDIFFPLGGIYVDVTDDPTPSLRLGHNAPYIRGVSLSGGNIQRMAFCAHSWGLQPNWVWFDELDSHYKFGIQANGVLRWGDSDDPTTFDVNLYRSAPTILKTDSNFTIGGSSLLQDPATENPVFNQKKGGADRMSLGHNGTDGVLTCWTGILLLASPQSIDTNRKLRINPTSDQPVLEFRLNGAERIFIGHNGTDSFVSSRSGKLQLNTVSGNIELSPTSGNVIISSDLTVSGGDVYVGGRRLYQDGSYLRSGSSFVSDGSLTVGSPVSTTYKGPVYLNYYNQIGYNQSSSRYKENITPVEDCSWIYDLTPVKFDWKDKERQAIEGSQIGLVAEEVYEKYPKLVFLDAEGLPEGVHYEWLGIPLLVEIKKLKMEVESLREEISALKGMKVAG